MDLRFVNPELLFLLWLVIPLAAWWYQLIRTRERNLERFVAKQMLTRLRPAGSSKAVTAQAFIVSVALLLSIVAAARPQWGRHRQTVYSRGRDVVIALDVSRSMLAEDVHPNRMNRAKADILDLLDTLEGDRAALIAFRNGARLLCPLTTDYGFLRQALDGAGVYSAPRGPTDLASAVQEALKAFENDTASYKAIVLISDGEDLSGAAKRAAELAAEKRIPIYTVGLGSTSGAKIPDPENPGTYLEYKGRPVRSRIEHEALQNMAQNSGGAYIKVGTAATASVTLGDLYQSHLRRIAARSMEERIEHRHIDRFQYFLLPAALLFMAAAFLSRGRLPQSRPAAVQAKTATGVIAVVSAALLASASLGPGAAAQTNTPAPREDSQSPSGDSRAREEKIPPGRDGARIARKLYNSQKYREAGDTYLQAARDTTRELGQKLRYNAAVAYYRAGMFTEAAKILDQLTAEKAQLPRSPHVVRGSALYKQAVNTPSQTYTNAALRARLLRSAAASFAEALRDNTDTIEVRHDTELARRVHKKAEMKASRMKLLEEYGKQPAFRIMDRMLKTERKIVENMQTAFTNDTPAQVYELEALAEKQDEAADLWIPLRNKFSNAANGTNAAAAARLESLREMSSSTENRMRRAAQKLRDLDTEAFRVATAAENRLYGFWKQMAPYHEILNEDIRRQTNAIVLTREADTNPASGRKASAEQQECIDLTAAFSNRFSSASVAARPPADPDKDDGKEALTPEKKKEILRLASEALALQEKAEELVSESHFRRALDKQDQAREILEKIRDMLPGKQQKSGQQNEEQQKKPEQQDSDKQKSRQQQPRKQPPEQQRRQRKEAEQKKKEKEQVDPDVKRIMEKALQRQREHEIRKRKRRSHVPLQPFEKDW